MLLGMTRDVSDQITTRGNLDGHSNDFAIFVQDDWKATRDLTVFLGLRYEIVGNWHEKGDILGNFRPDDGGYHVVPNAAGRGAPAAGPAGAGPHPHRARRRHPRPSSTRTRTTSARASASPIASAATTRRCSAAASACSTRRSPSRASATCSRRTCSVTANTRRGSPLQHGFSAARPSSTPTDFGNQGIDPNLQSPDIYQYNLTLERAISDAFGMRVSYLGSTMRKLLVDRDMNTLPANTEFFDGDLSNPDSQARLPLPLYGYYADNVHNAGSGQFNSLQVELTRRFKGGLALRTSPTPTRTPTATLPTRATAASASCSSIPTTSRRIAARTRTS